MFNKNKDKDELVSPISFVEPGTTVSPINFIDQDINTPTRYAINRLTNHGSYVRGNMLYFSFNGVEIYTDIDNIIFVNEEANILFIRENKKIEAEINPSNPESRQYIILYTDLGWDEAGNDEEFPLRWEAVTGRTEAYENIKNNAPVIDIDKSIVLVENVALKDSLSVRDFMNYIKNSEIIVDETFDINDYAGAEYM
jgi:hypothetical protein